MSDIESITKELPGLDCGSCGAPTCMAFAEDIVKCETSADECTVIMRQIFHEYLDKRREESLLERFKPLAERKNPEMEDASNDGE